MGSGVSKRSKKQQQGEDPNLYGHIYIKTDKTTYSAGDTVSGEIYINTLVPYPAKQLFLRFEGKEVINIDFEMPLNKSPYSNEKSIIKKEICIHTWDSLLPGHYAIPFTYILPQDLPPSFSQEGRTFAAHLTYKIEIFFKSEVSFKSQLKCEQKLIIRKSSKNSLEGHSAEVIVKKPSWCRCSKESSTMKVHIEKTSYRPGEMIRVAMELTTTGKQLNISEVSVILNQRLRLGNTCNWVLYTIPKAAQVLRGIRVPGPVYANAFSIRVPPFKGDDNDIDLRKKCWPRGASDDSYGYLSLVTKNRIISSELFLEISCTINGYRKLGPKIVCPLEMCYPEPLTADINLPKDWAPQKFPSVEVVFPVESKEEEKKGTQKAMIEGKMIEMKKSSSIHKVGQIFPDTGRQLDV